MSSKSPSARKKLDNMQKANNNKEDRLKKALLPILSLTGAYITYNYCGTLSAIFCFIVILFGNDIMNTALAEYNHSIKIVRDREEDNNTNIQCVITVTRQKNPDIYEKGEYVSVESTILIKKKFLDSLSFVKGYREEPYRGPHCTGNDRQPNSYQCEIKAKNNGEDTLIYELGRLNVFTIITVRNSSTGQIILNKKVTNF